jgi:hypothetical protein
MRQQENANAYWEERGGLDAATRIERDAVVARYAAWLAETLEPWMASIYPVLQANVWVGARDEPGGVINMLLLADAIGLQAYSWNLEVEASPFQRIDVIAASDPALMVLAELYAYSIPTYA